MKFLINLKDYENNLINSTSISSLTLTSTSSISPLNNEDIIITCILIYISLWILQGLLYYFLLSLGGEIWKISKNCDIIARLSVDTIAMILCCIFGYEGFVSLGGFESLTIGTAFERLYLYNPAAQRLLLFQMGYTFKTVGDALLYNDGIISLVHHIATGAVVALAFHPFLHTYAVFYVGLSEISTVPLCIVIALQNDRGVPLLKEKYPTFDTVIGILFSISFLICRIFLWGFYSYYFWQDLLELLVNNTAHSKGIVIWYLVANAGLSILQVYWLSSILKAIFDLFGPSKSKKAN